MLSLAHRLIGLSLGIWRDAIHQMEISSLPACRAGVFNGIVHMFEQFESDILDVLRYLFIPMSKKVEELVSDSTLSACDLYTAGYSYDDSLQESLDFLASELDLIG